MPAATRAITSPCRRRVLTPERPRTRDRPERYGAPDDADGRSRGCSAHCSCNQGSPEEHPMRPPSLSALALALAGALALDACASKIDGPAPTISAVAPSTISIALQDASISITGSGFSPVVKDGLTSTPALAMPQVFLIDPGGTQTEVPSAGVAA